MKTPSGTVLRLRRRELSGNGNLSQVFDFTGAMKQKKPFPVAGLFMAIIEKVVEVRSASTTLHTSSKQSHNMLIDRGIFPDLALPLTDVSIDKKWHFLTLSRPKTAPFGTLFFHSFLPCFFAFDSRSVIHSITHINNSGTSVECLQITIISASLIARVKQETHLSNQHLCLLLRPEVPPNA